MRAFYTSSQRKLLCATLVFFGFCICLAVNLPGHMSYDSVIQLWEGRNGSYAGWHPPFMSWLLGIFDAVLPGTALFVLFDVLLFFGSLASILLLVPRVSWWGPALLALAMTTPQLLIYQGIVWKDVLVADAAVAGFVLLAHSVDGAAHVRRPNLAAACLLFVVAALARQNGIVVILVGGLSLIVIALAKGQTLRSASLSGGGALVLCFAVLAIANVALGMRLDAPSGPARQIQLLQFYDVVGATAAEPSLDLGRMSIANPVLSGQIHSNGVKLYTPQRNDPLAASQPLQEAFHRARPQAVAAAWTDLVVAHPAAYLATRWSIFRWVFLTPDVRQCLPLLVGVSGPKEEMSDLDIAERFDDRDGQLQSYGERFIGTPIFSHAFYAIIALCALALLLTRRRPADLAMAGLAVAALLFTASFFFISIACDYRYLYFTDLAAITVAFYLALDPPGGAAPLVWTRQLRSAHDRKSEGTRKQ